MCQSFEMPLKLLILINQFPPDILYCFALVLRSQKCGETASRKAEVRYTCIFPITLPDCVFFYLGFFAHPLDLSSVVTPVSVQVGSDFAIGVQFVLSISPPMVIREGPRTSMIPAGGLDERVPQVRGGRDGLRGHLPVNRPLPGSFGYFLHLLFLRLCFGCYFFPVHL